MFVWNNSNSHFFPLIGLCGSQVPGFPKKTDETHHWHMWMVLSYFLHATRHNGTPPRPPPLHQSECDFLWNDGILPMLQAALSASEVRKLFKETQSLLRKQRETFEFRTYPAGISKTDMKEGGKKRKCLSFCIPDEKNQGGLWISSYRGTKAQVKYKEMCSFSFKKNKTIIIKGEGFTHLPC